MENRFDGFTHEADELAAYFYTFGIFVFSLKKGCLTWHEPADTVQFSRWLDCHGIRNMGRSFKVYSC